MQPFLRQLRWQPAPLHGKVGQHVGACGHHLDRSGSRGRGAAAVLAAVVAAAATHQGGHRPVGDEVAEERTAVQLAPVTLGGLEEVDEESGGAGGQSYRSRQQRKACADRAWPRHDERSIFLMQREPQQCVQRVEAQVLAACESTQEVRDALLIGEPRRWTWHVVELGDPPPRRFTGACHFTERGVPPS